MQYKIADANNPRMGLGNKLCINPKYWCRSHQVWLSENDVKKKECFHKPTIDMISYEKCRCLEKADYYSERRSALHADHLEVRIYRRWYISVLLVMACGHVLSFDILY